MDNFEDYLSHHGILGQKWGVRNALWYPIEAYKKSKTYIESVANSEGGKKVRSGAKKAAEVTAKGARKVASATKETAAKAKESYKEHSKKTKKKKQLAKARQAKTAKAEEAKRQIREAEDFEKKKDRILKTGTPGEVLSIADRLTNQDLQFAITRNTSLNTLRSMESSRIKDYKDKEYKKKWGVWIGMLNSYDRIGKNAKIIKDSTENIWRLGRLLKDGPKEESKDNKDNKKK